MRKLRFREAENWTKSPQLIRSENPSQSPWSVLWADNPRPYLEQVDTFSMNIPKAPCTPHLWSKDFTKWYVLDL